MTNQITQAELLDIAKQAGFPVELIFDAGNRFAKFAQLIQSSQGEIKPAVEYTHNRSGLQAVINEIAALSGAAYLRYIQQTSQPECFGWEAKVRAGEFGKSEFDAYARANVSYGEHKGLATARDTLELMKQTIEDKHFHLLSRIAELESLLAEHTVPTNGYAITHENGRGYLSFFKDGVEVGSLRIEYLLDGRFSQERMTKKARELLLGIYHDATSWLSHKQSTLQINKPNKKMSKWIKRRGRKKRPSNLDYYAIITVRFSDGREVPGEIAGVWNWGAGGANEIVAYRVEEKS